MIFRHRLRHGTHENQPHALSGFLLRHGKAHENECVTAMLGSELLAREEAEECMRVAYDQ